jgi:excisionase family DNA binding protein
MNAVTDDTTKDAVQPLAFGIPQLVAATGLSRTTIYNEIKTGRLRARKVGARTLVLREDLIVFLRGCRHVG